MKEEVALSVKQLIEFVLKSGSIDSVFSGQDRASEGTRLHRLLQKKEAEEYSAEVPLSTLYDYKGIPFRIEGRADGIYEDDGLWVIDEIKSTVRPLSEVGDGQVVHWAQAICYAFIYAQKEDLNEVAIRLRYIQVGTEEVVALERKYSLVQLETEFRYYLSLYEKWALFQLDWKEARDSSIRQLGFPYSQYRDGQRQLASVVYKSIYHKMKLFCEAPTGTGKTLSTLFPAVKAMGEGKTNRILYITAKTITRKGAEDTLSLLSEKGLRLKSIVLTAKDKTCFLEERNCTPKHCLFAEGYFDRVNESLFDMLQNHDHLSRKVIEEYASKHRICPFELSLDATLWCDVVICDYNYVFNPHVYIKRLFMDRGRKPTVLVDEAHNLVERAKDMYSAKLSKSMLITARESLGQNEKGLRSAIRTLQMFFLDNEKKMEDGKSLIWPELPDRLEELVSDLIQQFNGYLQANPLNNELMQVYFDILAFQKIMGLYSEAYRTVLQTEQGDTEIQLLCLDASDLLKKVTKLASSTIFFSATLSPLPYFSSVLGGDEECKFFRLSSPFDAGNAKLLIDASISTKYKDRPESIKPIAEQIHAMVMEKKGNYMIFFPSYHYLQEVYSAFSAMYPDIRSICQKNQMADEEREAFLNEFEEKPSETLIAFCILGGIFSEGIDLKGERLIGTCIVGVGLPQFTEERELLREYYHSLSGNGYEFAYTFPGMNRVLQAAGRVIRDEKDRGIILLIDSRYRTQSYRLLFPDHWEEMLYVRNTEMLSEAIKQFWDVQ
ncbi:ATP-dependent DNA helicase [Bacillus sp. 1P06AnD]|uniref:ATP-dependent DNA helicase n=1 Tax=Bacillus sp. 1P06AnD TaxID=3132208 RepID=UPI0039A07A25